MLLFDVVGEQQDGSSSWQQQQQQQQYDDDPMSRRQHSIQRRSIRKTATIGGSAVLECDIPYPPSATSPLQPGHVSAGTEHMIKWHKQGVEVPIFIQLNRLPAHIDANYQGRIRLLDHASVEISGIRASDEGWYECSVVFIQRNDDTNPNGTWVYLAVTGQFHTFHRLRSIATLLAVSTDVERFGYCCFLLLVDTLLVLGSIFYSFSCFY